MMARRGCIITPKTERVKILEFQHFVRFMGFGSPHEKGRKKFVGTHMTVAVEVDMVVVDTKEPDIEQM